MSLIFSYNKNQNQRVPARQRTNFKTSEVQLEPSLFLSVPNDSKRYALILYDETVPQPLWLHWLIVNIPGGMYRDGDEISPYRPPTPPQGVHTYTLALYEQKPHLTIQLPRIENNAKRPGFQLAILHPFLASTEPVAKAVFHVQPQN